MALVPALDLTTGFKVICSPDILEEPNQSVN